MSRPLPKREAGFVDQATLTVQAGRGGNGCGSLRRDPRARYAVPDGGDGGRGGDVLCRANPQLNTLSDLLAARHFRAGNGRNGSSSHQHGARGADCVVEVPLGTVLRDAESGDLIRELLHPGEEVRVARGGAGGVGSAAQFRRERAFESRRRPSKKGQAPFGRIAGRAGQKRTLRLELKLLADAGIIGFPNAGKSTLLSRISRAHPKVAAFPFTTLHPLLGRVTLPDGESCVAVDVPGLIEGAHLGKGLGLQFLRHIERTRLLIHLIDMGAEDGRDPAEDYAALNREMASYRRGLPEKPRLVVANKMDRPSAAENLKRFIRACGLRPLSISALSGEGIDALLQALQEALRGIEGEGLLSDPLADRREGTG